MRVLARYASKAAALAGEALHAAHKLASDGSIRGGPWLKAELTATDWAEISAVDACTSEKQVRDLRGLKRHGHLYQHLRDAAFDGVSAWKPSGPALLKTSGSARRRRRGLAYGCGGWMVAKWGTTDPHAAAERSQNACNAKRSQNTGSKR